MSNYSIYACLRTDKKQKRNGNYPIYFRLRVLGKETKIPTGIDVFKENWNDKKKEPKDKLLLIQLTNKRQEIESFINRLKLGKEEVTLDCVKDFCSGKKRKCPEKQSDM